MMADRVICAQAGGCAPAPMGRRAAALIRGAGAPGLTPRDQPRSQAGRTAPPIWRGVASVVIKTAVGQIWVLGARLPTPVADDRTPSRVWHLGSLLVVA
jgi:hypothetical protein